MKVKKKAYLILEEWNPATFDERLPIYWFKYIAKAEAEKQRIDGKIVECEIVYEGLKSLQDLIAEKDKQIQELTLKLEAAGDLLKFQIDEHRDCRNIEAEFWKERCREWILEWASKRNPISHNEFNDTAIVKERHEKVDHQVAMEMAELEARLKKKLEETK